MGGLRAYPISCVSEFWNLKYNYNDLTRVPNETHNGKGKSLSQTCIHKFIRFDNILRIFEHLIQFCKRVSCVLTQEFNTGETFKTK